MRERESRSDLLGRSLSFGLGRKWPAQPMGAAQRVTPRPHPPTAPSHQTPSARRSPFSRRRAWDRMPQGLCPLCVYRPRFPELLRAVQALGCHHCLKPSEPACLLDLCKLAWARSSQGSVSPAFSCHRAAEAALQFPLTCPFKEPARIP